MKNFRFLYVLALLCLLPRGAEAQQLIPKPVEVAHDVNGATHKVPSRLVVYYFTAETLPLAEYLAAELKSFPDIKDVSINAKRRLNSNSNLTGIHLEIDRRAGLKPEGYRLKVDQRRITVMGADYGGLFNGIQTLMQLFPAERTAGLELLKTIELPCLEIVDYPRFGYRGMHLDVARTFSTKEEVMRYIDNMSRYKINKFHWHLTDDEGWRIEIKSYPRLAEVGGFRGGDSPVMPIYGSWDEKYGGYYTQDEIREVIEYAALRNVEIIPEIDLPGHSRTAALVYPEILCAGAPDTLSSGGYDRRDVWCVAREENYVMLDAIMGELAELFPSAYLHIGGDEVEFTHWQACPRCQALMMKEGLKDGKQLQHHFMERLDRIVAGHGKISAVWDEAIQGGELPRATRIHGWQGVKECKDAASKGYATVAMPSGYFYFDMKYTPQEPGLKWAGLVPTEKIYSFDFDKEGFTAKQMENVIGVQGALWAELYLAHGKDYLDYQAWPRICALSEVAWTQQELRQADDFFARLDSHYPRLAARGIKYRHPSAIWAAPAGTQKTIKPAVKVTSSVASWDILPYSKLEEYSPDCARTVKTFGYGDHITFTFEKPVECSAIEIATGDPRLERNLLTSGYAEVLYDGEKEFRHYDILRDGRVSIKPEKGVKAIKLVSTGRTNGEKYIVFQPLRILVD